MERAFERAWVIWPLCAYRRRGRRIDPGAAIRCADRTSTDSPSHGRIRRYFRRAGQAAIPLPGEPGSPEFLSASLERQGFCRWRRCGDGGPHGGGAPHFAMGGPHRGGPHQPRCASERGLAMGGGRPRSAASRWEAAPNPWLCDRTGARVLEVRIHLSPERSRANFRSLSIAPGRAGRSHRRR